MLQNHIKLETFMILDSFLNLIDIIEKHTPEYDVLWPNVSPKLKAYKKMLTIDIIEAKNLFISAKHSYK